MAEQLEQEDPKLTVDQFADRLKSKYPQYKDIDNQTLVSKMLTKYPAYEKDVIMGDGVSKKSSRTASSNGGQPLNNGSLVSPSSLTGINQQNSSLPYSPATAQGMQQVRAADDAVRAQRQAEKARLDKLMAPVMKALPQEKKDVITNSIAAMSARPDRITAPTQEEIDHQNFMNTTTGKILGSIAYLGSKASKGTSQILKGAAWLGDKTLGNALTAATGIESDVAGDVAKLDDKLNYGLTKSDVANKEESNIMANLGGLAEFAPAIAAASSTGGATYYLQGLGQAKEVVDNLKKNGTTLNPVAENGFILGTGAVNGLLMGELGKGLFGKLPAALRKDITAKISADAIKEAAGKELTGEAFAGLLEKGAQKFSDKLSKFGVKALQGYNKAVVDLSALNAANFALKRGVDAVNDTPVFNETAGDLAENISNVATKQAPFFAAAGVAGDIAKLTPYSNYKNSVVESLMTDPSPENVDAIKQRLSEIGFDQNAREQWTPEQMDATFKQVDQIADIASKLPRNLKRSKLVDAVDLVQGRSELEGRLQEVQQAREGLDAAISDIPSAEERLLTNKIDQANDKLQGMVVGERVTYARDKENNKFYKNIGGKLEEITPERYELERAERDARKRDKEQTTDIPQTSESIPTGEAPTEPRVETTNDQKVSESGIEEGSTPEPVKASEVQVPSAKNENVNARVEEQLVNLENTIGDTRTREIVDKEAKKAIKDGLDPRDLVDRVLNEKHQASDTEVAVLAKHIDATETRLNSINDKLTAEGATMSKAEFDRLNDERARTLNEFQDVAQAIRKTGTETARALGARRFEVNRDYSLASLISRKREALGGQKLSEQQLTELTAKHAELEAANKKYQEELAKQTAQIAKLTAEKQVRKTSAERATRKSVSKAELKTERENIIKDFRSELAKIRKTTSAVAVPYARELAAAAPFVAKMVRNLAAEGVVELRDVITRIKDEFRDDLELTDKDVTDLVAGVYNEKKPTRTELDQQILELKREARKTNQTQLNDKIKELQRKIADGDYAKPEKPVEVKLSKEGIAARRAYEKLKADFDLEVAREALSQRSRYEKIKDNVLNIASLPRALKATLDFSAVLRQGLILGIGHPREALTALKEMFGQTFSETKYNNWLYDLKASDAYELIKNSKLYISEKTNPDLVAREEMFTSNLAEKIPGFGKLVAGAERAYSAYLNALRAGIFIQESAKLLDRGYTFEANPEQFKALAKVINVLSGRGDIPEFLGGQQPKLLSSALFSPRFMASRIQTLYLWADPRLTKQARLLAAKDIGATLATAATILTLAKASGLSVETDPRSTDFLKIKDGNTRYDILAGLAPYVVFLSQQLTGKKKSTQNGGIINLDKPRTPQSPTRLSQQWQFIRGKLAPLPGIALNLEAGSNVVGEKYTWEDVPAEFVPLPIKDVTEASNNGGWENSLKVLAPAIFGIGVSTYDANKKK